MTLADSAFPSSAAFDAMSAALASEADKKAAIKQGNAIFAIKLKNGEGKEAEWFIDLKKTGEVTTEKQKADVTLEMSEESFAKLVAGDTSAQKLFMGGKLKVKGNVMKATKLEPVLKSAQSKAKAKL